MASTSLETIRRITIEAQERGLADVAAKLDKVAKAQEGVVSSSESVTKSTGSVSQAFTKTERALDGNMRAYDAFAKRVKAVNDGLAQGETSPARATELIGLAEARLRKATAAAQEFGKATTEAVGPQRHEWINISRQLQDVGVQLAGGQGLFTIIAQQGPQLIDPIVNSKASLKDFATTAVAAAGSFLTAWGPVIGVATAVATAVYAVAKAADEAREARIATTSGRGRFGDVTAGQVGGLARAGAGGGVSLGESREGVLAGVREGLSGQVISQMTQQAQRLAATLGKDLPDATKILAGALREGAGGAKTLYDTYGLLDAKSVERIATVQQEKGIEAARLETLRLLPTSLVAAADATTVWGNAWANVKTNLSEVLNLVNKLPRMSPGEIGDRGVQGAWEQQRREEMRRGTPLETFRRGPSEGAMQAQIDAPQNKALSEAVDRENALEIATDKANQKFRDQVAVMSATTVQARALATQTQVYNQVLEATNDEQKATNAGALAGQMVIQQSIASSQQKIAAQEAELGMGRQLIAAASEQGAAGVALRAGLQEELAIRKEGGDVNDKDSQARIRNAEAIARQNLAIQDATQAAQARSQLGDQLEMLRLETSLIDATTEARARATSAMQTEIQARQAERQGLTETAAAYRQYKDAIAQAAAAKAGGGSGYEMAGGGDPAGRAGDLYRLGPSLVTGVRTRLQDFMESIPAASETGMKMAAQFEAARAAAKNLASSFDTLKGSVSEASTSFAAGSDKPMSQRGEFKSDIITSGYWQEQQAKDSAKRAQVGKQIADAERQGQQQRLGYASQTIQELISGLQEQKSALDENTQAIEDATSKRREQLNKEIAKLEKALNPARPDPYADRNPDYFYRFGTQAFKENDPMQNLLTAAEAELDGLDAQLETQKKAVELQQKAIDEQIKGYEAQVKELNRASNLLSAGVDLSAQEVAGIKGIIAAIQGQGDYGRLAAASQNKTSEQIGQIIDQAPSASPVGGGGGIPYSNMSPTQKAIYYGGIGGVRYTGQFASGGYIPKGAWGIAGEAGPEMINRPRAIAGPAQVTPIGGSRPIVVNQTIVSQGGVRELRASRGEMAQRTTSELRRSLGAA